MGFFGRNNVLTLKNLKKRKILYFRIILTAGMSIVMSTVRDLNLYKINLILLYTKTVIF